jgi:hypothetical protein
LRDVLRLYAYPGMPGKGWPPSTAGAEIYELVKVALWSVPMPPLEVEIGA